MQEIVYPTKERMNQGGLFIYETERGGIQISSARPYHELQYASGTIGQPQYFACMQFIDLYTVALLATGYRSIFDTVIPSHGSAKQDHKYDAGYKARYSIQDLVNHERKVIIALLIDGTTVEAAAKAAGIGKGKVKDAFIISSKKMAERFRDLKTE